MTAFAGGIAATSLALLAGINSTAAQQEELTMPFACAVQNGRLGVSAAASDRSYRIVGAHEHHPFTACAPSAPDICRTWEIHKFEVACDGGKAAWIAIVGATLEATPRRAWVEGGRVNFRMGRRWNGPAYDRGCDAAGSSSDQAACRRADAGELGPVIALPAGFAPMMATGGRFVPVAPPVIAAAEPGKDGRPMPMLPGPPAVSARPPQPVAETPTVPRPQASPAPPAAPATRPSDWITTTELSDADAQVAASRKRLLVLTMIALLLLATSAAIAFRRRIEDALAGFSGRGGASPPLPNGKAEPQDEADAVLSTEMIATAVASHQAVAKVVASLAAVTLRDVLARDLDDIRNALLAEDLARLVAAKQWRAVRAIVEKALGDLERVRRIAVSAVALEQGTRTSLAMPQTEAEAREIIGVNADASPVIVKKIVDALRQGWHPDFARDEADRRARELRTKQINVAWDLIARHVQAA